MSRIEVVPLGPIDGSDGHAFSVRRDGEPLVLLDAGIGAENPPAWLDEGARHDIVWISHGHHDHAGALPHLLQQDPGLDVVLPARAIASSIAITKAGGIDPSRAHAMFDNARGVKFHDPFDLGEARAECGPSGHGGGAGLIRLEVDGVRIGYTGDWALHPRSSAQPASLSVLSDLDLLICDCALSGAARLDEWSSMETISDLAHFVDHDGPRLLAVSPFVELDEVVSLLRHRGDLLVEQGLEPFVEKVSIGDLRACSSHLDSGGLVIAHGPAMRASDPAGALAIPHVTGPNVRIALFNSVPRGTPAAALLATKRRARRTVFGKNRRIRAQIRRFDLPTHATRPDLLRALVKLAPEKLLLFHHGTDALADFGRALESSGFEGEIIVAPRKPVVI